MPLAQSVLMVSPEHFDVNPEIVSDNFFVKNIYTDKNEIRKKVKLEFEELKLTLENAGIAVTVFNPHYSSPAPDAVFPNNWFSTHPDGTLVLYPMMSPLRRSERHPEIISFLKSRSKKILDLTENENQNRFLEGTGSIVIDNKNKIAFATASFRTHETLFREWCDSTSHKPVFFHATDENGHAVYHTNVILTIAENFAIICAESIRSDSERKNVLRHLTSCGLTVLEITFTQVRCFSGNALALHKKNGEQLFVISELGWNGFNDAEKKFLESHCAEIVKTPLDIIESCGGGSARCILAELF